MIEPSKTISIPAYRPLQAITFKMDVCILESRNLKFENLFHKLQSWQCVKCSEGVTLATFTSFDTPMRKLFPIEKNLDPEYWEGECRG
jgi:hypothetical protein